MNIYEQALQDSMSEMDISLYLSTHMVTIQTALLLASAQYKLTNP